MMIVDKIKASKHNLMRVGAGVGTALVMAVPAFAEEAGGGSSVATTISTSLATVQSDFMSTVTAVAPIALGIFGTFLVWKLGLRFFKSITGR